MCPIYQKYNFESKSQQHGGNLCTVLVCPIYQKYNFESKSQRGVFRLERRHRCVQYIKSTILKANHNRVKRACVLLGVCPIYQKYNFESKSQPSGFLLSQSTGCVQYIKSTILKANHNYLLIIIVIGRRTCIVPQSEKVKQLSF